MSDTAALTGPRGTLAAEKPSSRTLQKAVCRMESVSYAVGQGSFSWQGEAGGVATVTLAQLMHGRY